MKRIILITSLITFLFLFTSCGAKNTPKTLNTTNESLTKEKDNKMENNTGQDNKKEGYKKIASLLGLGSKADTLIDDANEYFEDNTNQYSERGIESYTDEDEIIWIGLVDLLIENDSAKEFDYCEGFEEFMYGVTRILPEGLAIKEEWIEDSEDGDITTWAEAINSNWENDGYVLASMDINSDSYVTIVCKQNVYVEIVKVAEEIGQRIDLLQNM